ncbi:MAG: 4-alpha-glucanotransferase [Alphaproteobacteria bacterium]|nr:4-alpha-glucanotransferase [Alphaproteobacteria bacterium]
MENKLEKLCKKLGIATTYCALGIEGGAADKALLENLCKEFGFDAQNDEKISEALIKLDEEPYQKTLEEIYIAPKNDLKIDVYVKKDEADSLVLFLSKKGSKAFKNICFEQSVVEEKRIGEVVYQKRTLHIKETLKIGYYNLKLKIGKTHRQSILAVAPLSCYCLDDLRQKKLWGFSLQLYALKSRRNWGVGDFTDLKDFIEICADVGADVVGLNPLNALFHDFPENASPYSSVSRLSLNPIYIDVEKVLGFTQNLKNKYIKTIEAARNSVFVDYTKVYQLKTEVLREIFNAKKKDTAFEKFKKEKGQALHLLALYQAIYHEKCHRLWGGWHAWPDGLKNMMPLDLAVFEQSHAREIEFFKFLQFEAYRQLNEVFECARKHRLKIGLYRDLPVGVSKDSAELWSENAVYMKDFGAGAPPDAFFSQGQKWCLGAFNPRKLKQSAYEPFLKVLRANMTFAGALRIDHVMSLMRLFMIEDEGTNGTYVYYNFEEMLALVALESHLNKCLIVGESIGNVPEGFIEKLKQNNIYSMSVLWAEREDFGYGGFKKPEDYESCSFVSLGTHDMTPLKMWWFGYEIELKYKLKMIDENARCCLYKERERDRWLLLEALDKAGVWPKDNLRKGNYIYGESYPEGLSEAVHAYLAKSESRVLMLQLEDILGVTELQNLPGTDRDTYPNWRHKLPIELEDLAQDERFVRNINAVLNER